MSTESDSRSDIISEDEGVIHHFGNSVAPDVVFHVGGHEFHCHKTMLALKCDYFAGMFNSGFKEKDEPSVSIKANPVAFKLLMEIIYYGKIEKDKDLFICNSHVKFGIENSVLNEKLWKTVIALFALANRFLLTDVVHYSIENSLLRYHQKCPHTKEGCYHCATKLYLAVVFNMEFYKEVNGTARKAITEVAERLNDDSITLSSKQLHYLLKRE